MVSCRCRNSLLLVLSLTLSSLVESRETIWGRIPRGGGHRSWGRASPSQHALPSRGKSTGMKNPLSPMYQVEEDDNEYKYTFELPDDLCDDLSVEIDKDAILHVRGMRKLYNPTNPREFVESKFSQSVSLTQEVDVDCIKVKRSKGKLKIVAPKIGRTKKLKIEDEDSTD